MYRYVERKASTSKCFGDSAGRKAKTTRKTIIIPGIRKVATDLSPQPSTFPSMFQCVGTRCGQARIKPGRKGPRRDRQENRDDPVRPAHGSDCPFPFLVPNRSQIRVITSSRTVVFSE